MGCFHSVFETESETVFESDLDSQTEGRQEETPHYILAAFQGGSSPHAYCRVERPVHSGADFGLPPHN